MVDDTAMSVGKLSETVDIGDRLISVIHNNIRALSRALCWSGKCWDDVRLDKR